MNRAILASLALTCLTVYFFVSAPTELPKQDQFSPTAQTVSVEALFQAVNSVNAHARQIYTSEIVGAGKKVGLQFGEDWKEEGVEKGPLPAFFYVNYHLSWRNAQNLWAYILVLMNLLILQTFSKEILCAIIKRLLPTERQYLPNWPGMAVLLCSQISRRLLLVSAAIMNMSIAPKRIGS